MTIQCSFDRRQIREIMKSLNLEWESDAFGRSDVEWTNNLTRVVDALDIWCKDSGIKTYGLGFTQIALQAAFVHGRDAMMFKLRWHYA